MHNFILAKTCYNTLAGWHSSYQRSWFKPSPTPKCFSYISFKYTVLERSRLRSLHNTRKFVQLSSRILRVSKICIAVPLRQVGSRVVINYSLVRMELSSVAELFQKNKATTRDVEKYIPTLMYRWHMGSRWYTSELHGVVTDICLIVAPKLVSRRRINP
jgi:hypothetical protein